VETFEARVLRGAQDLLSRTRFLLMEVTLVENDRYTVSSLFSLLSGAAFDFQLVALRNFSGEAEGEVPFLDCVFENLRLRDPGNDRAPNSLTGPRS
jgi:hypothetical protein